MTIAAIPTFTYQGRTLTTHPYTEPAGFAQRFIDHGVLRAYGYVEPGKTGHSGRPVKTDGRDWRHFREGLATFYVRQDGWSLHNLLRAARCLPSLSIELPGQIDGLAISWRGCTLLRCRYAE